MSQRDHFAFFNSFFKLGIGGAWETAGIGTFLRPLHLEIARSSSGDRYTSNLGIRGIKIATSCLKSS